MIENNGPTGNRYFDSFVTGGEVLRNSDRNEF